MTTEVEKCRAISRACKTAGKHITVIGEMLLIIIHL